MNQRKHVLPQLPENYIFYHRRAEGYVGDIGPIPRDTYKGHPSSFSFSLLPSRGEIVRH